MSKRKREIRLFLRRILLKLFKLDCPKHIVSEVTYNDDGDAYSKCRLCDAEMTLVGKTLGDVDKMTCGEIDALLPKGMTMDDFTLSANKRSGLTK